MLFTLEPGMKQSSLRCFGLKNRVGRSRDKAPFIHQSTPAEYITKERKIQLSSCLSLKEVLQPRFHLWAEDLNKQTKATQGQGSLYHWLLTILLLRRKNWKVFRAREIVKREPCSPVMRFLQWWTQEANHRAMETESSNTSLLYVLTSKEKM